MQLKRVDQALVDLGLAPSKTKAQELIDGEAVELRERGGQWRLVKKPATSFNMEIHELRLCDNVDVLRYVSRGGLKLEGALQDLNLDVKDLQVLDVGASTGGFTDCLLQHGVAHVTAIDVSSGELAPKLLGDTRVQFIGNLNVRNLHKDRRITKKFDLVVVDVSFISLTKVLPEVFGVLKPVGSMLALVKPQFEVGREHLDRRGIVKRPAEVDRAIERIILLATEAGFLLRDVLKSKIKGKDGNQEYFLYAQKT